MRTLRYLLAALVFGALFFAAWQFTHRNGGEVLIDLYFWQPPALALWVALLAAFGLGVAATTLLLVLPMARNSLSARRYRKAVKGLESEIHQLRNLPLAESEAGMNDAARPGTEAPAPRRA